MPKRRTTSATVAYVLDPDLAVPDVMDRSIATKFGIKNRGVPISFKNKKGGIKARGKYKKEKKDALSLIIDEIAPFIDLLVAPTLSAIDTPKKNMVFVKEAISTGEYSTLNSFGKQLYIKATDSLYDRYPVGSDYAGLVVPPPGRFGRLSTMMTQESNVKVRGRTTKNRKGMRHILVRLRDSSLLEFYTFGSSLTDSKVEAFFNKIIGQEPVVLKKFILAPALTNDLGRPAYRIEKAIDTLEGNEKLSTTPKTIEEVEYYYKSVPVEELVTVSEGSVLDLSSILPGTIFFKDGDRKVEMEYNKQFNRLITKYSPMTKKSARHSTAFVALAKLNSTTTSRYFNNTASGGSSKDLLHPAVLETILDEYINNKNRSSFIKVAVELLAGEVEKSAMSLSGYCTDGSFPEGSEMGFFRLNIGSEFKRITTDTAKKKKAKEAAKKKTTAAKKAASATPATPAQMLAKGKSLLAKYLPNVFGIESKAQPTPKPVTQLTTTAQKKQILSAMKKFSGRLFR